MQDGGGGKSGRDIIGDDAHPAGHSLQAVDSEGFHDVKKAEKHEPRENPYPHIPPGLHPRPESEEAQGHGNGLIKNDFPRIALRQSPFGLPAKDNGDVYEKGSEENLPRQR